MTPDSAIGLTIGGRFRITRFIGEGGMGAVYEAQHATLARRFAMKILHRDLGRDKRFVERFRREAVAASRVDHPNIAQVSDFGQLDSGEFYLVMEFLEGIGVDALIRKEGRVPLPRAIPILVQIADAMEHAHRARVVHRDLKPENVLLCQVRDQSDFVKILDFGIAKIQTQSFSGRLTLQGQIFGTAEYVSPEQAMDRDVDGRSDLYSLGVLAFEMTTGTVPFEGSPAEVLQAHVQRPPPAPSMRVAAGELPAAFDAIVLKLLAKKPEARFQSGSEVRREMLRLRAMLAAAAKGIYDRKGRRELRREIEDTGGWRPIGSKERRDVTLRSIGEKTMREISVAISSPGIPIPGAGRGADGKSAAPPPMTPAAAAPASLTPPAVPLPDAAGRWRSQRELRKQLQATLRKIGMALAEANVAPGEVRDALREILVAEEEIGTLANEIARLEQNFERIRFESGERETALRHAAMDLGVERAKAMKEGTTPEMIADLDFQIGELEKRLQEAVADKQRRIRELAEEVDRLRAERDTRERDTAGRYQALGVLADKGRPRVAGDEFRRLYGDLDGLREALDRARMSIAPA